MDVLELLGSEYVISHVLAEYTKKTEERLYRVYVSDVLQVLAESWGATISARYGDLIAPKKDVEDERTGDEVALEVIKKLGLKINGN